MSARIQKGVFLRDTDLLKATNAAREAGYRIVDAYTPFAVHGLDRAMGLRPSRLTWVCFLCGLFGFSFMVWFQFWTSAVDWPINVGGKPWNSWPAFVPVAFEGTILLAGLGVVAALFIRCGLRPGKEAVLAGEGVTDDRFVLVLAGSDTSPPPDQMGDLLRANGAVDVIEDLEEALS
ncbi:MAG: DUF3341 domain-containing protein [Planctomycetota bacterium]|jgi:hypothetical protein